MHRNTFNIQDYGRLASVFLILPAAGHAQVIVVDIDPDIVLDTAFMSASLDMDMDGNDDFTFYNHSFPFYDSINGTNGLIQSLQISPENALNGFAGSYQTYMEGFYPVVRYFPYAFSAGEIIGDGVPVHLNKNGLLAFKSYRNDMASVETCTHIQWFPELSDHYIGVRFIDGETVRHYGWIRCDVLEEGRTLVLKEYAYNTENYHPVVAGDSTEIVGAENIQMESPFQIARTESGLLISSSTGNTYTLSIVNMTGESVYSETTNTSETLINSNIFTKGIYILVIRDGRNMLTGKVFF